ncbi:MAG: hypothetical protein F4Y62_06140 [Rhodospirillaceae bacterium]|nr:hypothetical protein [Rhodospirillaceae bacterium]
MATLETPFPSLLTVEKQCDEADMTGLARGRFGVQGRQWRTMNDPPDAIRDIAAPPRPGCAIDRAKPGGYPLALRLERTARGRILRRRPCRPGGGG